MVVIESMVMPSYEWQWSKEEGFGEEQLLVDI